MFFPIYSQTLISGIITDLESKLPLTNVIIENKNINQKSVLSDSLGRFQILANSSDVLSFSLLGYEPCQIFVSEILSNNNIKLKIQYFNLSSIEISNEDANQLLKKAAQNLMKKLCCNQQISYLWHGVDSEKNTREQREGHALISCKLTKADVKKGKIEGKLNLIELLHNYPLEKKNMNNSIFYKNERIINVEYFPLDTKYTQISSDFDVIMESSNDSIIELRAFPKKKEYYKSLTMRILKKDTTLISYIGQSVDSILLKRNYKRYGSTKFKLLDQDFYISYTNKNDVYFLEKFSHTVKISLIRNNVEQIFESKQDVLIVNKNETEESKSKIKLNRFSKQLFELPNTTEADFWKEY